MVHVKDYRNTEYCCELKEVEKQKHLLEDEIMSKYPRTQSIYNKVLKKGSHYNEKFARIYNCKCSYCGALLGLFSSDEFEVDHFINKASFSNRLESDKISNLVWSCKSCNRRKGNFLIKERYVDILNVDNGNIAKVFVRDNENNIRISEQYQNDEIIEKFYKKLCLGHERRRLDYLCLEIYRKIDVEQDENVKNNLSNSLNKLICKRNLMSTTSE